MAVKTEQFQAVRMSTKANSAQMVSLALTPLQHMDELGSMYMALNLECQTQSTADEPICSFMGHLCSDGVLDCPARAQSTVHSALNAGLTVHLR